MNLALRLLLAAACLLPLASPRAYAGVFNFAQPVREHPPNSPFDEEEGNKRSDEELRDATHRSDRRPDLKSIPIKRLTMPRSAHRFGRHPTYSVHSTAEDPFRNGLGTPYRC